MWFIYIKLKFFWLKKKFNRNGQSLSIHLITHALGKLQKFILERIFTTKFFILTYTPLSVFVQRDYSKYLSQRKKNRFTIQTFKVDYYFCVQWTVLMLHSCPIKEKQISGLKSFLIWETKKKQLEPELSLMKKSHIWDGSIVNSEKVKHN